MAVNTEIAYAELDHLFLDPMNPRLGREDTGPNVTQERVLELMKEWRLDELAVSFVESGFWPQEALLVVQEKLYGKDALIVVEGNRRLAALKHLRDAVRGRPASKKWADIANLRQLPPKLFARVPYIMVDTRKDIEAFLGFRHVTGIEQWKPAEKAEYIAKLIDERNMSYEEVMRKIGSKTPAVRHHYIAYRLLRQMEGREDISIKHVEQEFSVLYLSLRTQGSQSYLQIDMLAEPNQAKRPVPVKRQKALSNYARWLFGDDKTPPLFTDSRLVDRFGSILESEEAIEYLERTPNPNFEVAYRLAGGDEPETVNLINQAADNIELALTKAHP